MNSYITLMTRDNYLTYTVALWDSWKKSNSKYDFVVAINHTVTKECRDKMDSLGMKYIDVDTSDIDKLTSKSKIQGNWKEALYKLSIFKLYQYDKLLFLDGDTVILKNLDHVFDMDPFVSTGRYNKKNPKSTTTILGGLFLFNPNEEDYNGILKLIDDIIEGRFEQRSLTIDKANDEHILSYHYQSRFNMLGCEYQYMPHEFNTRDIPWDELYLFHIGRFKSKWLGDRYVNHGTEPGKELKFPLSEFDYQSIYWYFNLLDVIDEKYELGNPTKMKTPPVDMTKVPVVLSKNKKEQVEEAKKDSVVSLW